MKLKRLVVLPWLLSTLLSPGVTRAMQLDVVEGGVGFLDCLDPAATSPGDFE